MKTHKIQLGNFLIQDLITGLNKKEKFARSFVEKLASDIVQEFQETKASMDNKKLIRSKKLVGDIDYSIATGNHKLAIELVYKLSNILN